MSEFGRWLGKENAKTMVFEIMKDCSKEQALSAVTTYCMILDVEVDTREWDELMREVWTDYNSWFDSFDEMENFFCQYLV